MKVVLIAAITADGFIAHEAKDFSMDWTSPEDVKLFVQLTKEAGVVIFGSTTAQTAIDAGRKLPGRRKIVYTRHPEKITAEGFEPTSEAPEALLKRLEQDGASGAAICGGAQINAMFMKAGLINELYLTVEPVLFGQGVTLFGDALDVKLQLLDTTQLNPNTIMLHYQVRA